MSTPPMKPDQVYSAEEQERFLLSMLQATANNLSYFYTQSEDQRKQAFEAGETYAIMKLNEWMLTKVQGGRALTPDDIFGYMQDKLRSWIPDFEMMPGHGDSASEGGVSTELRLGPPGSSSVPNTQEEDASSDMNIDEGGN